MFRETKQLVHAFTSSGRGGTRTLTVSKHHEFLRLACMPISALALASAPACRQAHSSPPFIPCPGRKIYSIDGIDGKNGQKYRS